MARQLKASDVKRACSVIARAHWDRQGDVAVLGSGVMGMATAMQIKQRWKDMKVDIISESTFQDSTSHGSGGTISLQRQRMCTWYMGIALPLPISDAKGEDGDRTFSNSMNPRIGM